MAQYRAIFKNANIAMFAAMAAAALAAGQAQAATDSWTNLAKDDVLSTGDVVFSGSGDVKNTAGFDLTIKGGSLTFHGDTNDGNFSVSGTGTEVGVIKQTGGKLALGKEGKSGATVNLESYSITGGELVLGDGKAQSVSKLKAKTITIGSLASAAADPAPEATAPQVTVGANGQLGGDSTTSITVNSGTLDFTDAVKAVTTGDGSITVAGGAVSVGESKTATFETPTLNVTGGTVTVNSGSTLKIDGKKATTISFAAGTLTNKGTIDLAGSGSTFKVAAADFKADAGVFADAKSKIVGSGSDTDVYNITLTGEGDVDLGLVLKSDASGVNADRVNIEKGKIDFNAAEANVTFNGNKIAKLQSGSFGNLTAGSGDALTIDTSVVTVNKGLTVSSATEGQYGTLALDNAGKLILAGDGGVVNAKSMTLGGTGKGTLEVTKGTWTAPSLVVTSGTATIETGATLVIAESGDFSTKDNDNSITIKGTLDASQAGTVTMGTSGTKLVGGKAIFDMDDVLTVSGDKVALVSTVSGDSVSGDAASVLQLQNAGDLSTTQIAAIKKALEKSSFGFLEFGGESTIASASGEKTWNDIKDTANIAGANKDVTLKADEVSGAAAVGNIKLDAATELKLNKNTLILGNASANNVPGKFVVNKSGETAGVQLSGAGSQLILADAGEIGSITVEAGTAKSGAFVVGHVSGKGDVTVKGTVGTAAAVLGNVSVLEGSKLSIKGDQATDGVFAKALKLELGSALDATGKTVQLGEGNQSLASSINGNLNAKELKVLGNGGSLDIAGNAVVDVETLTGATGITFNVGKDGVANGSATLIADTMALGGGSVFVDPDYDQSKASLVVMNLSGTTSDKSAGKLDGKVAVGKNAAFGVGFSTLAEMNEAIAPFLPESKFTADGIHNALVLDKQIEVGTGHGIAVGDNVTLTSVQANQVNIGAGSALVITDNVFTVAADGTKTGTAISFEGTGTANIEGSQLFLVGEFTAKDNALNIFESGSTVSGNMTVESLNGLLQGSWTNGAVDLNLTTDPDKLAAAFTDASAPVRQLMLDAVKGELGNGSGLGRDFITPIATTTLSGAVVDAAAHAATYAGAQQAAVVSVTTMADAMFGRVGAVGVEAASIAATGSQANGGVWLTPMYKSMDADGFNAEGVTYGSDVDAAGVAFGADTVNGNMRFGAVFNIGSGDAEGKGNGNGLKDEFDYYGFGIYSAMGFGNFALVC